MHKDGGPHIFFIDFYNVVLTNFREYLNHSFLLWYNAPNVIFYSEGPKVMPYGREIIERMIKILFEIHESYIIEIYKKEVWTPICDAIITIFLKMLCF